MPETKTNRHIELWPREKFLGDIREEVEGFAAVLKDDHGLCWDVKVVATTTTVCRKCGKPWEDVLLCNSCGARSDCNDMAWDFAWQFSDKWFCNRCKSYDVVALCSHCGAADG